MAGIKRVSETYYCAKKSAKGSATNGPYTVTIEGKDTYLRHYGTLIYHSQKGDKLVSLGGYSVSDRSAINTMLQIDANIITPLTVTNSSAVAKRLKSQVVGNGAFGNSNWYLIRGQR